MANDQLLKGPRPIGVFYPAKILESVPMVRNTITMLVKTGYIVEVFIYKENKVPSPGALSNHPRP